MLSAFDVACHVVNHSIRSGNLIEEIMLQRILFFLQGEFLCSTGRPLFSENFVISKDGPIIPSVHEEFTQYHKEAYTLGIPYIRRYVKSDFTGKPYALIPVGTEKPVPYRDAVRGDKREKIDWLLDELLHHSTRSLSQIIRNLPAWKDHAIRDVDGVYIPRVIPKEEILSSFKQRSKKKSRFDVFYVIGSRI